LSTRGRALATCGQPWRGIVTFIDAFEDGKYFHIVTELCLGGELYDRIVQQMEQRTTESSTLFFEAHAARIIYSILDSVAYLHDKDIVHRDLKPKNFIFSHGSIKLSDFGLAVTPS
jgi:serine/threonine protein kinase